MLKLICLWLGCLLLVSAVVPMVMWGSYFANINALSGIVAMPASAQPEMSTLIMYACGYATELMAAFLLMRYGLR